MQKKEKIMGNDEWKNEEGEKEDKIGRVLAIYTKLLNGEVVHKAEEAFTYKVNERSIQRDIRQIRDFMETQENEIGIRNSIIYDREQQGYKLEQSYNLKLTNSEVLAICKILLDSRAFTKKEMQEMLKKLIDCCVPKKNQSVVKDLIGNEAYHYIEPQHKTVFIDTMWQIGQAIRQSKYIEITYQRMKDKALVKRKLKPAAIMFSEYYFYLTAFIDDEETKQDFDVLNDAFPTIYRIDRIKSLTVCKDKFHTPYSDRFEEGEFRKRIQFMYGGKLRRIKFKYLGENVEAVLDRLPTAKILEEEDGVYIMSAEVFGNGVDMWIRSQGENIKILDK